VINVGRKKVMISIQEELLAEIDKAAAEENRNRSEFLREAARLYLEVRKEKITPGQAPQVQEAITIQDALARQDILSKWDSTAEIRRWREGNY
jgi:CopG family transcriptional regulator/antitoxin EndoAI